MSTKSNEEIAAERFAAKRRQRRAEWAWQEAVELPAERGRQAGRENIDALRAIDPAAADALEQRDRWGEIVAAMDEDDGDGELTRARRMYQSYRQRWVTRAATHPRLRHLVEPGELREFGEDLRSPVCRALRTFNVAYEEANALRARAAAGEKVDPRELRHAEGVLDVTLVHYRLEMDRQIHARDEQRREELAGKGLKPPLDAEGRKRGEWRKSQEEFVDAKLKELTAEGLPLELVQRLKGEAQ